MVIGKRGQVWETFIPWIIAITVLVLVLAFIFWRRGDLLDLVLKFKEALR